MSGPRMHKRGRKREVPDIPREDIKVTKDDLHSNTHIEDDDKYSGNIKKIDYDKIIQYDEDTLANYISKGNIQPMRMLIEKKMNERLINLKTTGSKRCSSRKTSNISSFLFLDSVSSTNNSKMAEYMEYVDKLEDDKSEITFKIPNVGISAIYSQSIEEMYSEIFDDKKNETEKEMAKNIERMKEALGARYISSNQISSSQNISIVDMLESAKTMGLSISDKKRRIDIGKMEGLDLVVKCAVVLTTGMKGSLKESLDKILVWQNNNTTLMPAYIQTMNDFSLLYKNLLVVKDKTNNEFTITAIMNMLEMGILSSLLHLVHNIPALKSMLYFHDSIFYDPACGRILEIIEEIETYIFIGTYDNKIVNECNLVQYDNYIKRIHGLVQSFSSALRIKFLTTGSEDNDHNLVNETIRQVLTVILLQKNGSKANPDVINNLFNKSLSFANTHSEFPKFKKHVEQEKITSNILKKVIDEDLFPYLLLYVQPAHKSIGALKSAAILSCPNDVIQISYELLSIKGAKFGCTLEDIKKIIKSIKT